MEPENDSLQKESYNKGYQGIPYFQGFKPPAFRGQGAILPHGLPQEGIDQGLASSRFPRFFPGKNWAYRHREFFQWKGFSHLGCFNTLGILKT